MEKCKTVTFGVIAYNEEKYLPELLGNLMAQTYPKKLIEVILVDSGSQDRTQEIMKAFKEKNDYYFQSILVLYNAKRVQPAGWNIVIDNSTADVLIRVDAHAVLPTDFIDKNMKCINSGEYVCGGPRTNIIDEKTKWKLMLLDAEQALFGAGIAGYRQDTKERKYVKSVFHGAYRREVLNTVGRFNENLVRTEDNEFHYRITKAGYKICYDPSIKSYYQTRSSLFGMLKQKYQNGLWIGRTLHICPGCISVFHLIPMAFVVAIVLTLIVGVVGVWWLFYCLSIMYLLFLLLNSTMCILKSKNVVDIFLVLTFFLMHLSYGVGTIVGVITPS